MFAEVLIAHDTGDPDTTPRARPTLFDTAVEEPPLTPLLTFAKTAVWDHADKETQEAFGELVEFLGEGCDELHLPEPFEDALKLHGSIMKADLAKSFAGYYERGKDKLTDNLVRMIEDGQKITAVITPAPGGEAPAGLGSTGRPSCDTLWTFCGTPAITLPLMKGPNGLPVGVQLVGRRGDDARLLRTARWLLSRVAAEAG